QEKLRIKNLELRMNESTSSTVNSDNLKEKSKPFSIREWVEDDKREGFLFITSRADQHETLKPLISTWLEIAINSLLSLEQNRNRKVWIIIDELPSLHYLPSLHDGLAQSRQFGGAFVLSMQLMAQLEHIYGDKKALSTNGLCRTKVILAAEDPKTARLCADTLGRMEVEESRESISFGANDIRDGVSIGKHESSKHIVLPDNIMRLEPLQAYVKVAGNFPVTLTQLKYKRREQTAEKFIKRINIDPKLYYSRSESFPPPSKPRKDEINFINSKGDGYVGMMSNTNYFGFNQNTNNNENKKENSNYKTNTFDKNIKKAKVVANSATTEQKSSKYDNHSLTFNTKKTTKGTSKETLTEDKDMNDFYNL
ncbi:type IV secretion system DNA-binding domain-containing protein, partial [Pseudomonadota bacterium]